ncbi:MAG: hypothetical protein R3F48_07650 [Candidatus Zixiibacteriota bacterium]
MNKFFWAAMSVALLLGFMNQTTCAEDEASQKITVKPYINILFASSYWEQDFGNQLVEDKTGIGFGVKIRRQLRNKWGAVLNASITAIETRDGSAGNSVVMTLGGYYGISAGSGSIAPELGAGFITAGDEIIMLIMPSIEYSRPVAERLSLAIEASLPIANDWFKDYDFKENLSSFSISVGAAYLF